MTIRHILGIFGGKDSAALFIGNPSVTSRRSVGGFLSSSFLRGFFDSFICDCMHLKIYPRNSIVCLT